MKIQDLLNKPTMTVGELSKKYKVAPSVVETELSKGVKVEMEHTNKVQVAREIALDHLGEDLYYYDKLSSIEKNLAEAVDQLQPIHDPTPNELKLLARRNKYHSARFVVYKPDREGQTHWIAADSEHFTHHSMAQAMGAWLIRGYVQYMGDGDYAYRSMEVYSPKSVDHPLFRTWERAGIQNGNPDQSHIQEHNVKHELMDRASMDLFHHTDRNLSDQIQVENLHNDVDGLVIYKNQKIAAYMLVQNYQGNYWMLEARTLPEYRMQGLNSLLIDNAVKKYGRVFADMDLTPESIKSLEQYIKRTSYKVQRLDTTNGKLYDYNPQSAEDQKIPMYHTNVPDVDRPGSKDAAHFVWVFSLQKPRHPLLMGYVSQLDNYTRPTSTQVESWSKKYKKSINCSNPKGFSQRAHCAGRKKRQTHKKTKSKSVSEARIDNARGWGNVPNNQDVDYLGLRVQMKPSVFLKLATPLNRSDATSSDAIKQHLSQDGAIASPWLIVKIPSEWKDTDYSKPALIVGHEGRNRMIAIQELEGDSPVEVHLFFSGGLRARHIQPDWIKQLNQRLVPQLQKKSLAGPFFQGHVQEDSTRTSSKGAPGTLKAKITRLYGGDVTCAKTDRLKRRDGATAHDKAQANWFQNKHCGGASRVDEIFSEPSREMPWRSYGLGEETFYETNFRFDDKNVVVEMHPDIRQISAKYVFSRQDLDLSPNHRGWVTIFRVDGITDITGEIGNRAAKLLAQVVSVIRGFLQKHDWDYVIFTGEEGSRDRLYQALAQRLASQAGAQVAKYRSDFVVYKSSNLTEAFDYKLEPHSWKVSEQDQDYLIIQFNVEGEPYDLEIVELSSSPGIYDVVFGHRQHIKPVGIIGTGHASKIFAAVAQLIEMSLNKLKIQALYFTASEPSRIKLYKVLSRYFANKLNWKFTQDPHLMPVKSRETQFMIYKPGFSITEQAGVGLVVPGVNMPKGIHPDEIRRQAKKFGFKTTKDGVPPTTRTNGKY